MSTDSTRAFVDNDDVLSVAHASGASIHDQGRKPAWSVRSDACLAVLSVPTRTRHGKGSGKGTALIEGLKTGPEGAIKVTRSDRNQRYPYRPHLGVGDAAHEEGGLAALSRHRPRQFPALGRRFPPTRPRQTDARDLGRQGPLYLVAFRRPLQRQEGRASSASRPLGASRSASEMRRRYSAIFLRSRVKPPRVDPRHQRALMPIKLKKLPSTPAKGEDVAVCEAPLAPADDDQLHH